MDKIRAKFSVESAVISETVSSEQVRLRAVYGGSTNAEDNTFAAATPNAQCDLTINNPEAQGFFKPGKKYYADFTEAPE